MWSGALLRSDGGKRGPALLDVLAAAVRTRDLFILMPSNGQSLQKGFLAVAAEEFVVRHTGLHRAEEYQYFRLFGRAVQHGSGNKFCMPGSPAFREIRVADTARTLKGKARGGARLLSCVTFLECAGSLARRKRARFLPGASDGFADAYLVYGRSVDIERANHGFGLKQVTNRVMHFLVLGAVILFGILFSFSKA